MREGLPIFDADRHVMEPFDLWARYLDPAFRNEAPVLVMVDAEESVAARVARLGVDGSVPPMPVPMWRGEPIWRAMPEATRVSVARGSWQRLGAIVDASHGAGQVAVMDRQGIDAAALMPTHGSYLVSNDAMSARVAHAFGRAYNRWLFDVCSVAPDRLVGVGLIARHDPRAMLAELRWVLDVGWRSVVVRPNPVAGRVIGHPDYAPFWAACAEAGVGVVLHEGTHARVKAAGADRFETRFALHACSHPMEQMMALVSLLEGGVFARHPSLRFAVLEAGCTWLPHWLWRLDAVCWPHAEPAVRAAVPSAPSEFVRRQCLIGFEAGEALLCETVAHLGAERLVFGTDSPHLDHDLDPVGEAVALRAKLPEASVRRMVWENAAGFFGVESGVGSSPAVPAPAMAAQQQMVEKGSASPVNQ